MKQLLFQIFKCFSPVGNIVSQSVDVLWVWSDNRGFAFSVDQHLVGLINAHRVPCIPINDVGAFCVCYSSDCKVILDVKKGILRLTVGHSKFVKHVDVDFIFQVSRTSHSSSLILKIDCSIGEEA